MLCIIVKQAKGKKIIIYFSVLVNFLLVLFNFGFGCKKQSDKREVES